MSSAQTPPTEHRSFADAGENPAADAVESAHPAEAEVTNPPAKFGNLKQNLTTHWQVQDR